jgi:hypothetical protein
MLATVCCSQVPHLSLQHTYLNPVNKISSDARLTNSPPHAVELQGYLSSYLILRGSIVWFTCVFNAWDDTEHQNGGGGGADLRRQSLLKIIWHVDPLLDNDSEIHNYITAVTRQWPVNSNRGTVSSVRSAPISYKQGRLVVRVSEWLNCSDSVGVNCYCWKLVDEAGDSSGTHRWRGTSAVEAAKKQRQWWHDCGH